MGADHLFENVRLYALAATLLGTLAGVACKSTSASDTKHEIGMATRRTKPFSCTKETPPKNLESLHAYLYDHLKRIDASSGGIIPRVYKAEQFCIVVQESRQINAYANNDGTIAVLSGLLKVTDNDAQFAAVVAHEMAHVLQGHGSERIPEEMRDNPDYKKFSDLMKQHSETLSKLDDKFKSAANSGQPDSPVVASLLRVYFSVLGSYASTLARDPYTAWNQDLYKNIVLDPIPEDFKDSISSFSKRKSWPAPTLKGMAQDARQKILGITGPKLSGEFLALEKIYLQDTSTYYSLITKLFEADRRAKAIMALESGLPRASNWQEQEADEVGFELYLRAGYDYREYIKMLENLEKAASTARSTANSIANSDESLVAAMPSGEGSVSLADEIKGTSCKRGTESHPESCWRMADIKQEWETHQVFYAEIVPQKPAIHVFGDRLASIKEGLAKADKRPPTSAAESSRNAPSETRTSTSPSRNAPAPEWCDPHKPKVCYLYCKSLTSDLELSGWGSEDGKTCVIKGGPVDRRY